jgi:hypothetical protein
MQAIVLDVLGQSFDLEHLAIEKLEEQLGGLACAYSFYHVLDLIIQASQIERLFYIVQLYA